MSLVHEKIDVVAIDELQFFDSKIIEIIETLANHCKQVIVAGLDLDYYGKPFSTMANLLARAEMVTKLTAICMVCQSEATRTQCLISKTELRELNSKQENPFLLGSKDKYEARCRAHHEIIN
jgi:thymidine kinase